MSDVKHVGLDVHAETVAVAICGDEGVVDVGSIAHRRDRVLRFLRKLGSPQSLRVVYEAGPTGYALCRYLRAHGYACDVVAPTLIPEMAGDRVKTDRRDAAKLARLSRAQLLTPVFVPSDEMESLRDLVRLREAAKADQLRARHRLSKFLLRHGIQKPKDMKKSWTQKHLLWLSGLDFVQAAHLFTFRDLLHELEHQTSRVRGLEEKIDSMVDELPALPKHIVTSLQALRGVAQLTAVTIVTEVGDLSRFSHPTQLMAYAGVVPSEHSSGDKVRRGAITKTGNAHLRRAIGESAWAYRFSPKLGYNLRVRQRDTSTRIQAIAWRAQERLHSRYRHLLSAGKHHNKVLSAVARELLGFVWHIGVEAEREFLSNKAVA